VLIGFQGKKESLLLVYYKLFTFCHSHPSSIDALCALTPDVILSGSSDGLIRAVQIFPTKFLGVLADHGEFPIERLKLDRQGKWLGSASHDEVLKLTDVGDALEDSDEENDGDGDGGDTTLDRDDEQTKEVGLGDLSAWTTKENMDSDDGSDEPDSDEEPKMKKKRRKKNKTDAISRKKGGAAGDGRDFFADL